MNKNSGFTLIELMIVVVIMGIIAAIALPAYSSYMTDARRAEAKTMLIEMAGEQYRYYSENNSYAADLTTLGYNSDAELSDNGFYSVSVTAQTASSYTLTAAPVAGSVQAENDTACKSLTINSIGAKGVTGTAASADCW